ncbi:hypothetical protein I5E68_09705 [Novosphingobium sp. YJ-S2-02]|uniref:Uncharacterized protein n=1 Tax=Novosphingobium aureum TaxID=2792964 RepID=A0A931HBY5_9SPHN|nr:hypothetical protein [Novosphingobium aureum]MBH0113220.1 hypothetical protein [Novosphingobium aureum]
MTGQITIAVHTSRGGNGTIGKHDDWTLTIDGEAVLDERGFRDAMGPEKLRTAIERLTDAAFSEIEQEALVEDAERWRVFFGSERFYVMGAAGFDWENACVREPRNPNEWLHFTLNIWDIHPAGDDAQGVQGRAMLLAYVDHLRANPMGKGRATDV